MTNNHFWFTADFGAIIAVAIMTITIYVSLYRNRRIEYNNSRCIYGECQTGIPGCNCRKASAYPDSLKVNKQKMNEAYFRSREQNEYNLGE